MHREKGSLLSVDVDDTKKEREGEQSETHVGQIHATT